MRSEQVKKVETTLVLNAEETQWLHDYMRIVFDTNETERDYNMRESFFDATKMPT